MSMSLSLMYPAALAALAALAIPVLLHLARREQHTPLSFAALRWLQRKAKPRQRIRIHEWLLLAVRLLMIAAAVLLLARPLWHGPTEAPRAVVAVATELAATTLPADLPADAQRVWLAPGFPPLEASPVTGRAQPMASLLRELDAQLPAHDTLTVLVPPQLRGADGQIPQLSRRVEWRVVPAPTSTEPYAPATAALRLVVRHDDNAHGLAYLRAVQRAWSANTAADIATDATALPVAAANDWVVWLSAKPVPADAGQGRAGVIVDARQPLPATAAVVTRLRDANGNAVLEQADAAHPHVLRWAQALQLATLPLLLDGAFPAALERALRALPAPTVVEAVDYAPTTGATRPAPPARELSAWLLVLLIVLAALERLLATSPRRRQA